MDFKKLSLKHKMLGIVGLLTLVLVISMLTGLRSLNQSHETSETITKVLYKRIDVINTIHEDHLNVAIQLRDVLLSTEETSKGLIELFEKTCSKEYEDIKIFRGVASEQGLKLIDQYQDLFQQWHKGAQSAIALMQGGKRTEAQQLLFTKVAPLRKQATAVLEEVVTLNEERMQAAMQNSDEQFALAMRLQILVTVLGSCLGIGSALLLVNRITSGIFQVVDNIRQAVGHVSSASTQIAASSEELSQGATEQAASVEETTASLTELTATINRNAEGAERGSKKATVTLESARSGRKAIDDLVRSMEDLRVGNESMLKQLGDSAVQVGNIVNVMKEIDDKTRVVNDIAFQTKLLAFNASVEAARAGQLGRGFAVVAEEVGNLAHLSASSAKAITTLVAGSLGKVDLLLQATNQRVAELTETGRQHVQSSLNHVLSCEESLTTIERDVGESVVIVQDIAVASKEQAYGVGEINKAMGQVDIAIQHHAAASEETASSAEELSAQAHALNEAVAHLLGLVEGGKAKPKLGKKRFATPVHLSSPEADEFPDDDDDVEDFKRAG